MPTGILDLLQDDLLWFIVIVASSLSFGFLVAAWLFRRLRYISHPFEALIFSGKRQVTEDGTEFGYRIVKNGRGAFRIPIIERVDRLDLRLLPVDIVVQDAYSRGNIPLQIHAIANVKIHSSDRYMRNAVERFLGRSL